MNSDDRIITNGTLTFNKVDSEQLCNDLWEEIPELLNILKGVE